MPLPPTGDTIAAIATAPGVGAIGVVRVSGPEAYAVADAVFDPAHGAAPSRRSAGRVVFGRVRAASGEVVDEALLLTFRAPHSYTGEDVVELQTHGGPAVLRAVLEGCTAAGARLAGPGEFTLRAFLHDRLDLVQAESVLALVQAQSDGARRHAALGLTRALSERLERVQDDVTTAYAAVQAGLDYPEEGVPDAELGAPLRAAVATVDALLATAAAGRLSRRGARLVLLGRPNTGKSSLLNALLGFERSLVSDTPGTTRDYLEAPLEVGGVPLTAIDTAGVRSTEDAVEASGVALSRRIAAHADVAVVLLDRSRPLDADDRALLREVAPERRIVVASKADLPAAWRDADGVPTPLPVSALRGDGVAELTHRIRDLLVGDAAGAEVWITEERHIEALTRVREHLRAALGAPDDLAALELQDALRTLSDVTGRGDIAEEALASIFARFCVGK